MRFSLLLAVPVLIATPAFAGEYVLTLKDHTFTPAELTVAANEAHVLIVKNEDSTAAEFESHSLHREKVIRGGGEARITLNPLDAGRYEFFDEFHESKARGVLVVK